MTRVGQSGKARRDKPWELSLCTRRKYPSAKTIERDVTCTNDDSPGDPLSFLASRTGKDTRPSFVRKHVAHIRKIQSKSTLREESAR